MTRCDSLAANGNGWYRIEMRHSTFRGLTLLTLRAYEHNKGPTESAVAGKSNEVLSLNLAGPVF